MSAPNPYDPPTDVAVAPRAPASERIEVAFELTEDDVVSFQQSHYKTTLGKLLWIFRIVGGLLVAGGALRIAGGETPAALSTLPMGGLLLGFGLWLGSRAQLARAMRKSRKAGHRMADLGAWNLAVSADGITFRTPTKRCEYSWASVERIAEGPEHVFVYTSPVNALIVPKRAVGSAQRALELQQSATRYLERDRQERGERLVTPQPNRGLRVLALWLVLILLFLAIWTILSPSPG